jgi:hypothetical protein
MIKESPSSTATDPVRNTVPCQISVSEMVPEKNNVSDVENILNGTSRKMDITMRFLNFMISVFHKCTKS